MAKDPAFLFYPGDWLGGTMGMTLEQKGCYLELLILQFNSGKFSKASAKQVLNGSFDLAWPMLEQKFATDGKFFWNERLLEEINKRRLFSESRRNNAKHPKKPKAYAKHMENEDENINEYLNRSKNENFGKSENLLLIPEMMTIFKKHLPKYHESKEKDYKPLFSIASFFCEIGKLPGSPDMNREKILQVWEPVVISISKDNFYKTKSLSTISNQIQELTQNALNGNTKNGKQNYGSKERGEQLDRLFAERYGNGGSTVG